MGHEPELVELVARLTGARIRLPTAALAWLHVDGEGTWRGLAAPAWLTPKLLDDAD